MAGPNGNRKPGRSVQDAAGDVQVIADRLGLGEFAVVGVSSGGPYSLAVAAGLADRVTRCATICGLAPYDASDLDFFEGMRPEEIEEWEDALLGEEHNDGQLYRDTLAWIDSLRESADLPIDDRDMLVDAFSEGLRPGPGGMFDDYAASSRPWGFDVRTVACPAIVMVAEDDTNVPPAHGRWLADRLPQARLVSVPGGHMDPHDEEEERVLVWAGQRGHR
jgi:pimeloyl-ACP methyl ester carboxylesterase